jgi:hypothetical protein
MLSQSCGKKNSNTRSITIPDFKQYQKAINTAWCWHKNRHGNQWNRTEDPDTNPCSFSHLSFDKRPENMCWRMDSFLNKWCWKNWISNCKRLKLDTCVSTCLSINSKWIKAINVRFESEKLLQERLGNTLDHTSIDNNFMNRTPIAQQ